MITVIRPGGEAGSCRVSRCRAVKGQGMGNREGIWGLGSYLPAALGLQLFQTHPLEVFWRGALHSKLLLDCILRLQANIRTYSQFPDLTDKDMVLVVVLRQPRMDPRPLASGGPWMPGAASAVHVQRKLSRTCASLQSGFAYSRH